MDYMQMVSIFHVIRDFLRPNIKTSIIKLEVKIGYGRCLFIFTSTQCSKYSGISPQPTQGCRRQV